MKTILKYVFKFLISLIPTEALARLMAVCIAKILNNASKKGGQAWDRSKSILKNAETWIHLFNEVYEDDTLDRDEEIKVAKAIEDLTHVEKMKDIIK